MSQITGIYKYNWFRWKVISKKLWKLPKVTPFYGSVYKVLTLFFRVYEL